MALREIHGIQYLRGIAGCAVVLDHAAGTAAFDKYFGQELLGGFLTKGAIGVDIFFMISGFIIAIVALSPVSTSPKVEVSEFARRRFVRIIPIMWVAIISYAALRYWGRGDLDPYPYLRALTLWPEGDVDPNPIWTLRQEAVFYVIFGLTFLGPKALRILMPVWVIAPLVYAALSLPTEPAGWSGVLWTLCHPANIEFGTGFIVGLIWLRWLREWTIPVKGLFIASTIYFALVMALAYQIDLKPNRVQDTLVSSIVFTPLLFFAVHSVDRVSKIGTTLGNSSCSIYLFHRYVIPSTTGSLVVNNTKHSRCLSGINIIRNRHNNQHSHFIGS